ncbi:MAG: type III pantothenate kinase [Lachnospiraceae bacterium]|nr:type III pantothenate kinase [Lachnospiraceae bacterium]
MILAIDIGNTNIVIGCIEGTDISFVERISTDTQKTTLEYASIFKMVLDIYHIQPGQLKGSILSSVVPPINHVICDAIEKVMHIKPMVVGPGVKTGLNILIDNPAQLGSDLVVDAVAALKEYPAPLIIIDMGTATTMSAIDAKGNFLGGTITPGIRVALESLVSRTSLLSQISLEPPKKAIGSNTIDSMKSGSVLGNAAMLDGMIDRFCEELQGDVTVVATGGLAQFIVPLCRHEIIYDDALLLKGLWYIYEKNS